MASDPYWGERVPAFHEVDCSLDWFLLGFPNFGFGYHNSIIHQRSVATYLDGSLFTLSVCLITT